MLVIVSDLHLTDGTTGATTSPGAFQIFAERVQEMAVAASWRADGSYRPVECIDLVLLGDIFDLMRSAHWSPRTKVRPWSNPHSPEFVEQIAKITSDIIENNQDSLAVLRSLSAEGFVTVPAPLRTARPAADGESEPVPVRIHYMTGNHDWFFHLPGPNYDAIRRVVVDHMGLANEPDQPFAHDMIEDEELLNALRRHKVCCRHGDIFDPFNYDGEPDVSSLGDAIVLELVNRFSSEAEATLGGELPGTTIVGLREIDNIRPLVLIPVWIDGLLERTCPYPTMRKKVKQIWDRLVDEFLSIDFVRRHDTASPFDLVDGLARILKFSKRLSVGWASAAAEWLQGVRGANSGSYYPHALAEQDFRNRRAKYIVYGHTHAAESVPLDASYAEGFVLEQLYFNSGTWRRLHGQTQLAPSEHEFLASDVMTYTAIFQGDERKGRPYETWSGSLGCSNVEPVIHRIDQGHSRQSTLAPSNASALLDRGPHFQLPFANPGPSRKRTV